MKNNELASTSGTELSSSGPSPAVLAVPASISDAVKQVIVIRRDLKMRQGKAVSQGAHASGEFMRAKLLGFLDHDGMSFNAQEVAWMRGGMAKITVRTDTLEDFERVRDEAIKRDLSVHVITDAGHTEFHGVPTVTALAIGPDRSALIDEVTACLTLL